MSTKYLSRAAIIAAIYAAVTLLLAAVSFGPVQLRASEALTILPVFTTAAIPGLTIGCIVANLMGGYGIVDVIFGSAATLLGALGTRLLRKTPLAAALCPVVTNALIVGPMLYFVDSESPALLFNMLTVGGGELVSCVALGLPLMWVLRKRPRLFEL